MKEDQLADGSDCSTVHLYAALPPGDHRHAPARRQCGYCEGQGPPRPAPHHHHPDLRQAPAIDVGECVTPVGRLKKTAQDTLVVLDRAEGDQIVANAYPAWRAIQRRLETQRFVSFHNQLCKSFWIDEL